MMLDDLSSADERIDEWESAVRERVTRAAGLAARTAALTGSAKDRDGLAEVRVDSIGAISHLWLSERVRQQSAAETAQLVMTTMRAAQADLAQRLTAETVAAYGANNPATAAIVANVERRLGLSSGSADAAQ
jgi:phenylpyruvate tautomerase PptA (4-oxalocrotonate tautomerase family)